MMKREQDQGRCADCGAPFLKPHLEQPVTCDCGAVVCADCAPWHGPDDCQACYEVVCPVCKQVSDSITLLPYCDGRACPSCFDEHVFTCYRCKSEIEIYLGQ